MKIMTFNTQHCLNFIEQKIDFDIMAKTILDFDADIVGLNEMRGDGESPEYTAQVEKLAELTGMKYYYFAKAIDVPSGGPYGNGILSKIPIIKTETILIPEVINRSLLRKTLCFEGGIGREYYSLGYSFRTNTR